MKLTLRFTVYVLVALALFAVLIVGPSAWAAAPGKYAGITVPTRTPTRPFTMTSTPAPAPGPTAAPVETSAPAPTAAGPGPVPPALTAPPAPTVTAASAAALTLAKQASRQEAWPGSTVSFTLTLTNTGAASARQIVLEDVLPPELDPGSAQGAGAAWDGRTLRASAPVLPPGGRLVVSFTATVRADAAPGTAVIINRATAAAAGGLKAAATAVLALPPVELPPTGGGLPAGLRSMR